MEKTYILIIEPIFNQHPTNHAFTPLCSFERRIGVKSNPEMKGTPWMGEVGIHRGMNGKCPSPFGRPSFSVCLSILLSD